MSATLIEHPAPLRDSEAAQLLEALVRLRRGEGEAQLPHHWHGTWGRIADVFNEVVAQNLRFARELDRLSRVVGQ